ncbi:hypothetical protein QYF36_019076 [Acer negundo]|nr:hypothetical protein QYF36_019076 [Acer negundo]
MDMVSRLVAERPVVIFSRTTCSMSHAIKTLILNFGANLTIYELDEIPNSQQVERELVQLGCQPSIPAVFIGQQFIGGANQIPTPLISLSFPPSVRSIPPPVNPVFVKSFRYVTGDHRLFSNPESSHLTNTNPRWTKTGQITTTNGSDLATTNNSFGG